MKVFSRIKDLIPGVVIGTALSVSPLPLNLLLAVVLLGLWLIQLRRRSPIQLATHFVTPGIAFVTAIVAILLPVKQLDGAVAPFRYEQMSIDDLCQRLRNDHRVLVRADRQSGTNMILVFGSERPMSRREVLQQLALRANCELRIGYCGTGATLLFGAHPCFTKLQARIAQPHGPSPASRPTDPEKKAIATGG